DFGANVSDLRAALANLMNPLLELLVQSGERTLQAKISIYGSVRLCLRDAYVKVEEKNPRDKGDDWLTNGVGTGGVSASGDPIAQILSTMGYELSQCISRDIVDLPLQHKCTPLLLLGDVLYEDKRTVALTRLALTDSGWDALAQLALPEVLAQLQMFAEPPKQMFLQPTSIKEKGSPAELYVSSFDAVIQLCSAICAKPKWKRLSFKILDVVHSQTELLSQLMRAEVECRMMSATALLVQYIYDNGTVFAL
ncbi:hypothetical protein GCK32_004053, partial [Trichostrongylus colubriformis]